ncbi:hypothetical protein EUX98_g7927 [Antrodiella citrinella]|uniref:AB hydrolase-1 domain-containing protein n=1 Tax=Antrodiella citrinella TaxID=2447956 RepID=A0A4S4MEZ3_9APHY|nr:hypothetical protein EUX98_g7927 [Antrodiella citrinella]
MALFLLVAFIISLFATLHAQTASISSPSYRRIELTIPVHVSTNTDKIAYDTPKNQTQLTGLVQQFFSAASNLTALVEVGTVPLTASYEIYGELYVPHNWNNGVLEFAVHGSMLDHNYWLISGPGSMFNYVEASVNAGNAIFVFDRLGNGGSSQPDGIKEVQAAVHIAIIESLLTYLRTTTIQGHSFNIIVGVGHSYGSVLLANLLVSRPDAIDAVVLSGFTADGQGGPLAGASIGWRIASQSNHTAFGSLSNSYMTAQNSLGLQQGFFLFPGFPQSTLDFLTEHRGVLTVGELLSNLVLPNAPSTFSGPVLMVTGDHDLCVSSFSYIADQDQMTDERAI